MSSALLALVTAFIILLYGYFKWSFQYWKRKGIISPNASFPFGHFKKVFLGKENEFHTFTKFYIKYKAEGYKYIGYNILLTPIFMPMDLNLIKAILVKDHYSFMNRGVYYNERDDPLSAHMFNIEDKKWQILRAKLSPTFTSGKMKMMFATLLDVGRILETAMIQMSIDKKPVDIKDIVARYSTDVIGSCAFGIECNSFADPDSIFRRNGEKFFKLSFFRSLRRSFIQNNHELARNLRMKLFEESISSFFLGVVKDTLRYRAENKVDRNDFMKLLIEIKNGSSALGTLTEEEIAAQAFLFFNAGFETSSTTMTFCLFELAQNQDIQNEIRDEIHAILKKYNGELTYEGVKEMNLLNSAIDETLRMYPPVPSIKRICTRPFKIPDTNIVLEKDTFVSIPSYSMHYDPEYYPNPTVFDPTRFLNENKQKIPFGAYLPFGEGPRNCIGLRFGLMQSRVGIISILKNFKVTLNVITSLPIELDPLTFTLSSKDKIYLNIERM